MKSKPMVRLAASVVVGLVLTAWFLHSGGLPVAVAAPQSAPENRPAPSQEDAARLGRLERERLVRKQSAALRHAAL